MDGTVTIAGLPTLTAPLQGATARPAFTKHLNLPSLPPDKSEAYQWVDEWFMANVPSYQIHLAPREF
jgi:hypothetical protein